MACKYCATSLDGRLHRKPPVPVLWWRSSVDLLRRRLLASPSSIFKTFADAATDDASRSLRHQQTSANASPRIVSRCVWQRLVAPGSSAPSSGGASTGKRLVASCSGVFLLNLLGAKAIARAQTRALRLNGKSSEPDTHTNHGPLLSIVYSTHAHGRNPWLYPRLDTALPKETPLCKYFGTYLISIESHCDSLMSNQRAVECRC